MPVIYVIFLSSVYTIVLQILIFLHTGESKLNHNFHYNQISFIKSNCFA
jgi:hypothetical protein